MYIYIHTYIHIYIYTCTHTYTHICIYNGILFIHQKELNIAIYSNMDEPRGYYTKWSKPEREK